MVCVVILTRVDVLGGIWVESEGCSEWSWKNSRPNLRPDLRALVYYIQQRLYLHTGRTLIRTFSTLRGQKVTHAETRRDAGKCSNVTISVGTSLIDKLPMRKDGFSKGETKKGKSAGCAARRWVCARITFIQPYEAARPTEPDKTYLNSNHPQKPAYPTTAAVAHCTLRHGS